CACYRSRDTSDMAPLVVFEGIDGSGKSTQIQILHDTLVQKGYNPLLTREPGGTPLGETVAHWLKTYPNRSPLAELFLFAAARAEHVAQVIQPALDQGRIVLCDRFTASTLAHQGYGRGLDLEMIAQVNRHAAQGLQPSLTIFLDVPVATADSRKDTDSLDVFEREGSEFRQKARQGYSAMAADDHGGWLVIDGSLSKESIARIVWERVQSLLAGAS
ncbi:MAG: dTMP kinase, partial [Chloroflexi bacterium]|nr:dTMP kinase [Chloroflexota bacterium]